MCLRMYNLKYSRRDKMKDVICEEGYIVYVAC